MTDTQIRVLKKQDDSVCIVELNTSPSLVNDYYRKTHFIFCMDVSASMDEPAVNLQTGNYGVGSITPENTRLNYITRILGACLNYVQSTEDSNNDILVSVVTFSRRVQTIVRQANGEAMTEENIKRIIQDVKNQRRESTNFEAAMKHIMSDVTLTALPHLSTPVNEIVVFMTDGCITQGTNSESELASIMVGNHRQIPDWRFIGVGTDFDYLLLNSLKLNIDKRHQLTNRPVVTIDFMDNIENAYIIYADVISPYLTNSVYNATLTSLDEFAPVYFGNPTSGILDSKQFHLGIIPTGTTRYVSMRLTDDAQSAFGYSDSKFHPCHGPATTNKTVTAASFASVEDNYPDSVLFDVMKLRQECIEAVGTCYKIIDDRVECPTSVYEMTRQSGLYIDPNILGTPRRQAPFNGDQGLSDTSSSDEEIKTPQATNTPSDNELSRHKECLLTLQQKVKDFMMDETLGHLNNTLSDILKQSIDDISFAIRAIDSVLSSGQTVLARMVIGARLNSQQYQRAYTITSPNLLDNPNTYENNNLNWSSSSNVHLLNDNTYSPFTTQVTRSISQAISSQSQFY